MKFVIDMNLTPEWVAHLAARGYEAVHWSRIGRMDARDDEIVSWARDHDRIVLTSDLDFGTMLAMSGDRKPSVVQLRTDTTLPGRIGSLVMEAIGRAASDLRTGAILTIEAKRLRIRTLGFDRNDQA